MVTGNRPQSLSLWTRCQDHEELHIALLTRMISVTRSIKLGLVRCGFQFRDTPILSNRQSPMIACLIQQIWILMKAIVNQIYASLDR